MGLKEVSYRFESWFPEWFTPWVALIVTILCMGLLSVFPW